MFRIACLTKLGGRFTGLSVAVVLTAVLFGELLSLDDAAEAMESSVGVIAGTVHTLSQGRIDEGIECAIHHSLHIIGLFART